MRIVLHFLLVILAAVIIHYFNLISYGLGQAKGQMSIIWEAQPIDDYLANDNVPDSVRVKLLFIEEVRKYAVDSLGLNQSDNYTSIYDQQGEPVLWVVTGCKPYAFEAKEWRFPVLGSVPYKGFFDKELAAKELLKVEKEGLDAGIRTVGGWSTLGWFNDPILSNMLQRSYGDLANLIIHELVHATVFVRDSVEFNENLASFIGDQGALAFMKDRYGIDSEELKEYQDEQNDERLYIDHILRGVDTLEVVYASMGEMSAGQKKQKKEAIIQQIMNSTDTLSLHNGEFLKFIKGQVPNNTYFMSFLRYRSKQVILDSIYQDNFNRQIRPFVGYMKEKHPYL
ncbi:aminopeptidase [Fulvivirga sp. RKSG066]|uniref:aminopeptidase n=1 Tax=Fulvivirga aurantia TaxID=2529383 RepID=UPI0012BD2A1B|nr:aminopeptidase [Fulvivirga aurantia]MTI21057.1 aminopeptidase [Fulvivirga aurantia]